MKDLYYHLIGLQDPWIISEVNFDVKLQQVDVYVSYPSNECTCSKCNHACPVYDFVKERTWRHLDSCGFKTFVHAQIPRSNCKTDGIHQIKTPWAEPHSRFTLMFQTLAIQILKECTVSGAAKFLRISWDSVWHIMKKAVERGLSKKSLSNSKYIGVDEKSVLRGHDYFTIVYNLDKGSVEYIANDRNSNSLSEYFEQLTEEQKTNIEAVAMDMWDPYIKATKEALGNNKIVIDRFHVMKHVNKAVDEVRKKENKELIAKGESGLKNSKYLWLYAKENIPKKSLDLFEELKQKAFKVSEAWGMKELLRSFWDTADMASALRFFISWYEMVEKSILKPMKRAADTIASYADHILMYFKHRITNATSEGLNSKIQKLKAMACGYRNKQNFKTAIYFHCGDLELIP